MKSVIKTQLLTLVSVWKYVGNNKVGRYFLYFYIILLIGFKQLVKQTVDGQRGRLIGTLSTSLATLWKINSFNVKCVESSWVKKFNSISSSSSSCSWSRSCRKSTHLSHASSVCSLRLHVGHVAAEVPELLLGRGEGHDPRSCRLAGCVCGHLGILPFLDFTSVGADIKEMVIQRSYRS